MLNQFSPIDVKIVEITVHGSRGTNVTVFLKWNVSASLHAQTTNLLRKSSCLMIPRSYHQFRLPSKMVALKLYASIARLCIKEAVCCSQLQLVWFWDGLQLELWKVIWKQWNWWQQTLICLAYSDLILKMTVITKCQNPLGGVEPKFSIPRPKQRCSPSIWIAVCWLWSVCKEGQCVRKLNGYSTVWFTGALKHTMWHSSLALDFGWEDVLEIIACTQGSPCIVMDICMNIIFVEMTSTEFLLNQLKAFADQITLASSPC